MNPVFFPEFLSKSGDEPFIIPPGEIDVNIVIPGDKPLMANRAEHRAAAQGIRYFIFLADRDNVVQNAQKRLLDLLEHFVIHGHKVFGF